MLSYMKFNAFKQLQFLAKSLILGLFLFLSCDSNAKVKEASFCIRALSHAINLVPLFVDVWNVPGTKAYIKDRQCTRESITNMICTSDVNDLSLEDFLKVAAADSDPEVLKNEWVVNSLKVTQAGSHYIDADNKIHIADLIQHYEEFVEEPYSELAIKTFKALLQYHKVLNWIKQVNEEALKEMWKEGLRKENHVRTPTIRSHYLDKVLARRAAAKGFKIKPDGMPYEMTTINPYSFHYTLARGRFFVDWSGEVLGSTDVEAINRIHGARGHTLAMAYLADHVPDFVELVKYIGRTQDRKGIWGQMFDNALSTNTPFWGGFWVINFSKYLYIPN